MKKIIMMLVAAMITCGTANAQFGGLGKKMLNKAKDKVEKKVEQNADRAVDKAINKAERKASNVVNSAAEKAGITSLPARQASDVTGGKWIVVNGTNVNLRNAPSMRGEILLFRLEKGEYAMKLDETREWVKIYLPDSEQKYAWIYKKYAPEVPLNSVPEFFRQISTYEPVFDGKMN